MRVSVSEVEVAKVGQCDGRRRDATEARNKKKKKEKKKEEEHVLLYGVCVFGVHFRFIPGIRYI